MEDDLEPIELYVRQDNPPPTDLALVVRGGPLTVEKFLEHARRQQRAYSWKGRPMASVSADMTTVGGWTLESILQDRLWSRSTYGVSTVGALRQAGYSLLPTYAAPHYDIVLPALTEARAATLLALFSPPRENPYRRRRPS